jgi:hypothetical protein
MRLDRRFAIGPVAITSSAERLRGRRAAQVRVTPEPAGVASGHARDVRHSVIRGQMPGHAVGLQIMRIDDVERAFG